MKKRKRIPGGIFALVIALAIFVRISAVITQTTVYGNSMQPTMEDGDHLIINRLSYLSEKPERFDIVIFSYQYRSNTYYIKRVIGLPGERIRINEDGIIYVNGNVLIEHYGNAAIMDGGLASKEIVLGEDEYFVLGDNRNDSTDSRDPEVANIKESDIVGKAWACIWPLKRWGTFK